MKFRFNKTLLYSLTALWLVVLILLAFVFEVSQTTLLMVYITGQGFLTALWIPYWKTSKKCMS